MSHLRYKCKYNELGAYGVIEEKTLYADCNNTCDIVTFYDDRGNHILSVEDTLSNNIVDAIISIYTNDESKIESISGYDLDNVLKNK